MPRAPRSRLSLVPVLLASSLPLAACGSGSEQSAANTAAAPDTYVAQVRALPPGQRDGVLLRAIRDAGQQCQLVTKSQAIDDVNGAPAWAATCDDRDVWVVAINPGGVATVTRATAQR